MKPLLRDTLKILLYRTNQKSQNIQVQKIQLKPLKRGQVLKRTADHFIVPRVSSSERLHCNLQT